MIQKRERKKSAPVNFKTGRTTELKVRNLLYHLFWFGVIYCLLVANYWQLQKMFPGYFPLLTGSNESVPTVTDAVMKEVSSVTIDVIFSELNEKLSAKVKTEERGLTFYRLPEGRMVSFNFNLESEDALSGEAEVHFISRQSLAESHQIFLINGAQVSSEEIRFTSARQIEPAAWQTIIRVKAVDLRKGKNIVSVLFPYRISLESEDQNQQPAEIAIAAPLIFIGEGRVK